MYGFSEAQEIVGVRLADLVIPSDPHNIEYLRTFIRSGYRWRWMLATLESGTGISPIII